MFEVVQSGEMRRRITKDWDDAGITYGRRPEVDGWDFVPSHKNEDLALGTIARRQGFTGKPQIMSRAEMDDLIGDGYTEIFRGMKGSTDELGDAYLASSRPETNRSTASASSETAPTRRPHAQPPSHTQPFHRRREAVGWQRWH